jgi:prolyl-tRNA editing enzyme YbaK/EbsC (Cys-tRNA(Pro) deacylase)
MDYEQKLQDYIKKNKIKAEHLTFKQSCHSVADAAKAVNANPDDFIKSMCVVDSQGYLIVAIVRGEDRASTKRVSKALNIKRPEIANPKQILEKTGYPVGGVPPFGYNARFLIDPKVMEKEYIYGGGGSPKALTKISPLEMKKGNKGKIIRIRK